MNLGRVMDRTYWHKQSNDEPLYPDLLWSRPEHKNQAGKLLIVGGNLHGFTAPADAYRVVNEAGIGTAKVLLPDALRQVVGPIIENGEYAPSTPSGSFSQKALAELLSLSNWADGVLLAGDFGRNSETAVLLEKFLEKSTDPVILTKDSLDYFNNTAGLLTKRSNTALVLTVAQLQRLSKAINPLRPIRFNMDLLQMVEALHELSGNVECHIVTKHLSNVFVASHGQVSSTRLKTDVPIWRVKAAANVSVWWLQNQAKPFESLTLSVLGFA